MIQLVAYMVAAYGVARLLQTSEVLDKGLRQIVGVLGIVALGLLAAMVTQQANEIGSIAGL